MYISPQRGLSKTSSTHSHLCRFLLQVVLCRPDDVVTFAQPLLCRTLPLLCLSVCCQEARTCLDRDYALLVAGQQVMLKVARPDRTICSRPECNQAKYNRVQAALNRAVLYRAEPNRAELTWNILRPRLNHHHIHARHTLR